MSVAKGNQPKETDRPSSARRQWNEENTLVRGREGERGRDGGRYRIAGSFRRCKMTVSPSENVQKHLHSAMPPHSLAEGLTNADRGPLGSGRVPEGLKKRYNTIVRVC